jgi:HPt (histidine-containing phosphotransfer) domain-containing protein
MSTSLESLPVLDAAVLAPLLALDDGIGDFLAEVIEGYLAESPETIAQLLRLAAEPASPELIAAAHRLKGSSSTLGVSRVSALCARIEDAARAGTVVDAATLATLAQDFALAASALADRARAGRA